MLYKRRKKGTKIDKKIARTILEYEGFKPRNLYAGSLSYTNDVYLFKDKEEDYVVKFFTDQWMDKNSGKREIELLSKLRNEGLPVPEVLFFKKSNKNNQRNFMIMKKLKGYPLHKKLNEINMDLIDESISLLKDFSKIKGDFGFFGHNKRVHKTYNTHYDFINDGVFIGLKKLAEKGYNVKGVERSFLQQKKYDKKRKIYSLTHHDFTPKHIFIENGKITGLIDFEWAIFSEPINDAVLFLTSLSEFGAQKVYLKKVYDYCSDISNKKKFAYYCARVFILKAAWPHKKVKQPEYSQICLNRARFFLEKGEVNLSDITWPKNLRPIED